jgi:arylsulfatase A-like enzyme
MHIRLRPLDRDIGAVLAAFIGLLVLENLVIGIAYRSEFAGSWEMASARTYLSPIALGASVPFAFAAVGIGRLVVQRRALPMGIIAFVFGAVFALGISGGRHFANPAMRILFVLVTAAISFGWGFLLTQRLPLENKRHVALLCGVIAVFTWTANAFVLVRLYPALHAALLVVGLFAAAGVSLAWRGTRADGPIAMSAAILAVLALLWTPIASRAVSRHDNVRRVMLEHAPILGPAVVLAARSSPPPPMPDDKATVVKPEQGTRALDWTGRDIVLVTIDALRADHVSAYGYARKTTPNIDRLAAAGARFTHAYCPTPHTSYSVTSMMTGKYVRPLLAMDAGGDSETWASYLKGYGYRTSAFYPPAVFFIDAHRFASFKESGLGFEYKKEEFADPALRRQQVATYLASIPTDQRLFLWLHLFEPHEPYVRHEGHEFTGDDTFDAYDSEVKAADALLGDVVDLVEKRKPGAIVIVSADHGEEFGDHGGRYHGTTVYEEQVRVPLVVVAPGVAPRVVATPVQTIDLLPTVLAALDTPTPARLRGRDLGPILAGKAAPDDPGLAFAETDDYTMVATGKERLVCARKIASCTLYDVALDPLEKKPIADRPERVAELRKLTAAIEREHGKLEAAELPEALRRGMSGDRDAAEDVATLFDDARVEIRRKAVECAFRMRAPELVPQLKRAAKEDDDVEVKRWSSLALARLKEPPPERPEAMLDDARFRVPAALVLAERGDARGERILVARLEHAQELEEAREIVAALATIRSKNAVPVLVRRLSDVRLRPFLVDALATIKDARAKEPLLALFKEERYLHLRPREARALFLLGAREELRAPMARFAGVDEPMVEAVAIARDADLLRLDTGGFAWNAPPLGTRRLGALKLPKGGGAMRLLVLTQPGTTEIGGVVDGVPLRDLAPVQRGDVFVVELGERRTGVVGVGLEPALAVRAAWVVARTPEIPPPPPAPWVPPPSDGGL